MGLVTHIQTLWSADLPAFSGLVRLEVDGSDLLIHEPDGRTLSRVTLDGGAIDPGDISTVSLTGVGNLRAITFDGATRSLDQGTLDRLSEASASLSAYLDGSAFYGNKVTLIEQDVGASRFLHVALEGGAGFETFRIEAGGALTPVSQTVDTASIYAATIPTMTTATVAGRELLVVASQSEDGLSVFETSAGGGMTALDSFGATEFLPIDTTTVLRTVEIGADSFILVASQTSSSLTTLRLEIDGTLTFVDQVADQLTTRFATTTSMDVAQFNGQTVVAVAGIDGGVTVWTMTDAGRLVLRDTIVDQVAFALGGIAQLQFVEVAGALELFALSSGENGIARLRLDSAELGQGTSATLGGAARDVIMATPAGGTYDGAGGNDILVDGAGLDQFLGGTGADQFVFALDNEEDVILDFDPGVDTIDLSAYPLTHGLSDVAITALADGARLQIGSDSLRIYSSSGGTLDAAALAGVLIFDSTHVFMLDAPPVMGTAGSDVFELSPAAETVDGGDGVDTVDYSGLSVGVTVDLSNSANNGGGAAGDVISNVENVIATSFGDVLTGDAFSNRLEGGDGDDQIAGAGGLDWILPGLGSNVIDGGDGRDMVSYADLLGPVVVDLALGTVTHSGGSDALTDIEGATGTSFSDRITGDSDDNELRGLGGADWFIASAGSDIFDGGGGRDMVSYVDAPAGVGVDLGTGNGLWGLAAGDSYIGVERITGSSFADTFYGSSGADDFRGLGGADWFVGSSGGRDRYDGGAGQDTVSYANSASGVTASLGVGIGSGGDAADDEYVSIERLTGSSHDDHLTGDGNANVLRGLGGRDTLRGAAGDDRLEGGGSPDVLQGGAGFDVAVYAGNFADYEIDTSGSAVIVTALVGNEATDTLTGIEQLVFADTTFDL